MHWSCLRTNATLHLTNSMYARARSVYRFTIIVAVVMVAVFISRGLCRTETGDICVAYIEHPFTGGKTMHFTHCQLRVCFLEEGNECTTHSLIFFSNFERVKSYIPLGSSARADDRCEAFTVEAFPLGEVDNVQQHLRCGRMPVR